MSVAPLVPPLLVFHERRQRRYGPGKQKDRRKLNTVKTIQGGNLIVHQSAFWKRKIKAK